MSSEIESTDSMHRLTRDNIESALRKQPNAIKTLFDIEARVGRDRRHRGRMQPSDRKDGVPGRKKTEEKPDQSPRHREGRTQKRK